MEENLLRRDQIAFVEKDRQGGSHLYCLAEIKGVKAEALQREYLCGRYGATPVVGDFKELFEI